MEYLIIWILAMFGVLAHYALVTDAIESALGKTLLNIIIACCITGIMYFAN